MVVFCIFDVKWGTCSFTDSLFSLYRFLRLSCISLSLLVEPRVMIWQIWPILSLLISSLNKMYPLLENCSIRIVISYKYLFIRLKKFFAFRNSLLISSPSPYLGSSRGLLVSSSYFLIIFVKRGVVHSFLLFWLFWLLFLGFLVFLMRAALFLLLLGGLL